MKMKIIFLSKIFVLLIIINFISTLKGQELVISSSKLSAIGYFIENKGQWDDNVLYFGQGNGVNLWVTKNNLIFDFFTKQYISEGDSKLTSKEKMYKLSDNRNLHRKGNIISMEFIESNQFYEVIKINPSSHIRNYFIGNDQNNWAKEVREYETIQIKEIYSGIDLKLSFVNDIPRYDFIISKNADPNQIAFKFNGIDNIEIENEDLKLKIKNEIIYNANIMAYQEEDNTTNQIPCKFQIEGGIVKFALADHNKDLDLIIDPIVFSTFLGGLDDDRANSLAIDKNNNILIAGFTSSEDFPKSDGAYDTIQNGFKDCFISKIEVNGTKKQYFFSTFFGGGAEDEAFGIATDFEDNIYITGTTSSQNFPLLRPIHPSIAGAKDVFITKFNPDGSELIYSTYLGGNKDDYALAIAVGETGAAFITGGTMSTNFPYTSIFNNQESGNKGLEEVFVSKVAPSGSSIEFTSLITTSGNERGNCISINEKLDAVLIGGQTDNARFQTKPNSTPYRVFDRYYNSGVDGFLALFGSNGGMLTFSSFLGGFNDDKISAVHIEPDGTFFFAGRTSSRVASIAPLTNSNSSDFPITNLTYDPTFNGEYDGFFGKMDRKCETLLANTYFGGKLVEDFLAITKNQKEENIVVTGYTNSPDYPIIKEESNPKVQGLSSILLTVFSIDGLTPIHSTVLGGFKQDVATSIKFDSDGELYLAGYTSSTNFPLASPIQKKYGGGDFDAFVLKNVYKSLTLNAPASKDEYCGGKYLTFAWSKTNFPEDSKFKVELSEDNGTTWSLIKDGVVGYNFEWLIPKDMSPGSNYKARVSHSSGLVSENEGNFKIVDAGILYRITTSPQDLSICEGNSVTFFAQTNGLVKEFQWRLNGKNIEGATDSILTVNNLLPSQSGTYDLVYNGQCIEPTISSKIIVNVVPYTLITSQPNDTTIKLGQNLTLRIISNGSNLTYEWFRNSSKILGATESTYSITGAQKNHEGYYNCIVTGKCGKDTSSEIRLVVDTTTVGVDNIENLENNLSIKLKNYVILENSTDVNIYSNIECNVSLILLDNNGRVVNNLYDGFIKEGNNIIKIEFNSLVSGIYWIVAKCGDKQISRKIQILR